MAEGVFFAKYGKFDQLEKKWNIKRTYYNIDFFPFKQYFRIVRKAGEFWRKKTGKGGKNEQI